MGLTAAERDYSWVWKGDQKPGPAHQTRSGKALFIRDNSEVQSVAGTGTKTLEFQSLEGVGMPGQTGQLQDV